MQHEVIKEILFANFGFLKKVADFSNASDLYDLGVTSLQTVNLMLELEDHFAIQFPPSVLSREAFRSVDAINGLVQKMLHPDLQAVV